MRAAYFGEEVQRLQRGRFEVKVMVRYPPEERKTIANLEDIRIQTVNGSFPITELAEFGVRRGYSEINRINQKRAITVTADVKVGEANAADIIANLSEEVLPEVLRDYPGITVDWEGEAEQNAESFQSLLFGFACALLAMYVLLTLQFQSYFQPLIIMFIIPFGVVGAIWGHFAMGLLLTMFTLFGLVALTGVVVNDSIVLIDFINRRVRDGIPMEQALLESGVRRFRPIMLTSLTTIAGLVPLLLEKSFQAQLMIPMAASLAFGLMLATFLVLFLVPTFYSVYLRIINALGRGMGYIGLADREEH